MIELYVEFEQHTGLDVVGEEVNIDEFEDINWEEDNNDSEENFEANYEIKEKGETGKEKGKDGEMEKEREKRKDALAPEGLASTVAHYYRCVAVAVEPKSKRERGRRKGSSWVREEGVSSPFILAAAAAPLTPKEDALLSLETNDGAAAVLLPLPLEADAEAAASSVRRN
ncbi:hypothetical protein Ahy_A03g012240 isoform B [Arachis hypogaea]|uniref:Uncharacterized protein n=1 Tax=Arachis hypogaea TaxID=3818 RepID=A0A445DSV1_ARAHY|nr:hypothetical protein Ahy_A03g012240 isoform B [Arachis hypogaea]